MYVIKLNGIKENIQIMFVKTNEIKPNQNTKNPILEKLDWK